MNDKRRTISIIALAIILMVAIGGCSSTSSGGSGAGKTIDLMQYVIVTISGDNGYGNASSSFDYGAFEKDLAAALGADINSTQFFADAVLIEEGIKVSLDNTSNLSNGDTVILPVSYSDTTATDYKLTFTGGTKSFGITELTEITEFSASDADIIALLSETTVMYYGTHIPFSPDDIQQFTITDTQVDYQRNTAQVDYSYEFDCTIAMLSVTGSLQYMYQNDSWENAQATHISELKEYTLSGVYEGREWGIADGGASCNARYVISETADGVYQAEVTWSANDESPDLPEQTVTVALTNSFETLRFVITNINSEIRTADGKSPYFSRALKFDFTNGGFTTDGEIELIKVSA